jgi:oxygen-dependent protoporphyrinogen oxidase
LAEPEAADVVVVGGGIAGLAAAHTLHGRGLRFALLEASPRWGGVIRTETEGGFVLEAGPDSMLAQKPEALALCRELGLGERLTPTNTQQKAVYVLRGGRLHALPEGLALAVPTRVLPMLRSRLFSWPGKLRMGLDLLLPARRDDGDESIASFIGRRFGAEAVELIADPLMAGIHAGDPERLSMRATFPRFVELERRHGSLIRGMWRAAAAPARAPAQAPAAGFFTLREGLRELVDALVARLPPAALHTGARALALSAAPGGLTLTTAGGRTWRARAIVLALPPPQAAALLQGLAPAAAAALQEIPMASSAVVFLGYRREHVAHPLDGYGLLVARRERLRTTACSFFSTKFPGRAPEGHVLLRGFVGGVRDPGALELDDDALAATVSREMAGPLALSAEPVLRRVYRWPRATPQLEVGQLGRVAAIERELAALPGVFLAGAGLRATGLPDTIAEASRAAAQAAALADAG